MTKQVFIDKAKEIVYSKVELYDQRIVNAEFALETISLLKEIIPKYDNKDLSRHLQKINDELKEKKSNLTLQRYKRNFYPEDVWQAGWMIEFVEAPEVLEPVIIFSEKKKIDANNTIKALSLWEDNMKAIINDDEELIKNFSKATGYIAKILELYSELSDIEGSRHLHLEEYLANNATTKCFYPGDYNHIPYWDLQDKVCTKGPQDVISYLERIQ